MTKKSKKSGAPIILLSVVVLILAMFCGLLIGAEAYIVIAILVAVLFSVPLLYLTIFGIEDRRGSLLLAGMGVMLVSHLFQAKGLPVGYLLELASFALMFASCRRTWALSAHDRPMRLVIYLYGAFLALAVLSTLLGRSHKLAAGWQLQYDLKLPLMFALGVLVANTDSVHKVWRFILTWTWVYFLPFMALEVASPGLYVKLFGAGDTHANPVFGMLGRLNGPFSHSGYLAIIGGLLATGALVQWLNDRKPRWLVFCFIYFVIVAGTGQRQEGAAMVLTLLMLFYLDNRRNLIWMVLIGMLFTGTAVFALLYMNHLPFESIASEWGGGRMSELSERAILTENGFAIANQYFPLGSGLGTYGGAGAQKFDLSLFNDMGFGRYSWFRQGLFLVDTFWPSIVAESGYFGMLMMMCCLVLLWCVMFVRAHKAQGPAAVALLSGLSGVSLLLLNSPTSAVLSDPRGAFVFWLLAGWGWRATRPLAAEAPAPAPVPQGRLRPALAPSLSPTASNT